MYSEVGFHEPTRNVASDGERVLLVNPGRYKKDNANWHACTFYKVSIFWHIHWSRVLRKAIERSEPIPAGTARKSPSEKLCNAADVGVNDLTAAHCGKRERWHYPLTFDSWTFTVQRC
jgi:hypothetical protein